MQEALQPLLATTPGAAQVIGEHEAVPPFDLHCPLMSLPLALAKTVRQIPADMPYLQADAARAAQWRPALETMGTRRPASASPGSADLRTGPHRFEDGERRPTADPPSLAG